MPPTTKRLLAHISSMSRGVALFHAAHGADISDVASSAASSSSQCTSHVPLKKVYLRCPGLWDDHFVLGRSKDEPSTLSFSRDYPKGGREPLRFSFVDPDKGAMATYGLGFVHVWTAKGMPLGVLHRDSTTGVVGILDLATATGPF